MYKLLIKFSLCLFFISYSCGPAKSPNWQIVYIDEINQLRADKDSFFKYDTNSPLSVDQKENFDSLSYFPPNTKFRLIADLVPIPGKVPISIVLNNGQAKTYLKYGFATFTIDDVPNSLLVLKPLDGGGNTLFVPFYDKTNGFETYGGGRYLDASPVGEGKIILDFNKAYNPYCVYTPEFVCALPPKENIMQIAINAGEKYIEIH